MQKRMTTLPGGETVMHKLGDQIPDGMVLGARGTFGPYAPNNRYNQWFAQGFEKRFNAPPNYASYQMAQAILGVKLAWEKAQDAAGGKRPTNRQVGAAPENITLARARGAVKMAPGQGRP